MAALIIFIACFIIYRRRQQKKEVSGYNQNTDYRRQESSIAQLKSTHDEFTSSNTGLSGTEPGYMSQVSRNHVRNDTVHTPFYLPDSLVSSSVQNSSPKSRSANPRSTFQSIAKPRSNTSNSAGTGQSSNFNEEAWREEVNNLRMEIDRIREETV